MPEIISIEPSQNVWNRIKSLWKYFQSFKSFTKVTIITFLLVIMATPFIVSNYQIFNPHAAVVYDVQSINSGSWSDPCVWDTGVVPKTGDNVQIKGGHTVTYDVLKDDVLGGISIQGSLKFSRAISTRLKVSDNIIVENGGLLDMGTSTDYIPKTVKAEVIFVLTQSQADSFVDVVTFQDASKGLWAMDGSKWEVYGAPLVRTWSKLSGDALPGAITVTLENDTADWPIGGNIVLSSTRNPNTYYIDGRGKEQANTTVEHELRTIQSLEKLPDGKTKITLNQALTHKHDGVAPFQGEVALLTRNILFKTEITGKNEADYLTDVRNRKFAHTAYMMGGANPAKGNIQYAEFKYMGHYGAIGTYAIHLHQALENSRGMVIRGTSGWYNGFRCVDLHVTHGVLLEDNVCYNSQSTAYFQEQDDTLGVNSDNVFVHNIAIGTTSKHFEDRTNAVVAGEFGRVSSFWPGALTTNEAYLGNVVAGDGGSGTDSSGYGFPEKDGILDSSGTIPFTFVHNESHSVFSHGIFTWQNQVPERDIVDALLWRNGEDGVGWGAYGTLFQFFNANILENGQAGLGITSVNSFLQDSTITGSTADNSQEDKGFSINAYISPQLPGTPIWIVRNKFKNLKTSGISQNHSVCQDPSSFLPTLGDRPVLSGLIDNSCGATYTLQAGNTFENTPKPLDFAWQANPNSWWKVYDFTGLVGLPKDFVVVRKDQQASTPPSTTQGILTDDLINTQTFNSTSLDALVTPLSSLPAAGITYTGLLNERDLSEQSKSPSPDFTFTTTPLDYPPQISLTVTLNGKVATLKATPTDDKGITKVEFFKDYELIDTKTSSPYETTIDLSTHPRKYAYLYARAFDGTKQTRNYEQKAYSSVTEIGPEVLTPAITPAPIGPPASTPTPVVTLFPTPTPIPTPIPILTFWGEANCVVDGVATIGCIPAVLKLVIQSLLMFAGIVAVFLIVHSGAKFVLSSGDPKKVEEARNTLVYAVLGLLIVVAAFLIINLVSFVTGVKCIKFIGFECGTSAPTPIPPPAPIPTPIPLATSTPSPTPLPIPCSVGL